MSIAIKTARMQTARSGVVLPGVGDPGFFGDLFGKAVSIGRGALTGGVSGAINAALGRKGATTTVSNGTIFTGSGTSFQQQPTGQPPRPAGIDINLPFHGEPGAGVTFFGPSGGGGGGTAVAMNGNGVTLACQKGFHPNKTGYFVKGDCRTGTGGGFIEKGTKCVRDRRRNSLNPRALDRAMGRITSAKLKEAKLKRITIRKKC